MTPTPHIDFAALRQIEHERRRVEGMGARAIAKVGQLAYRHAAHALRLGHDPVQAARHVILGNSLIGQPGLSPIISKTMMLAYLTGRRRTQLDIPRRRKLSRESDQMDRDKRKLLLLLLLDEEEIAPMQRRMDVVSDTASLRAWGSVERRLTPIVDQLQRGGLPNVPRTLLTPPTYTHAPEIAAEVEAAPTLSASIQYMGDAFARAGMLRESPRGAEAIADTAGVRAYEKGRMDGFSDEEPEVAVLKGWTYCAILDNVTTKICRHFGGGSGFPAVSLPKDHPFWVQWTPPNHWGCRSTVLPVWTDGPWINPPPGMTDKFGRFSEFFLG